MPSGTILLARGQTLTPGTPIEIVHYGDNHKIYETVPVCKDGISAKSSLSPKQLEGCVRTNWQVCITDPSSKALIKYRDNVRTEDLAKGKMICLCKKSDLVFTSTSLLNSYARTYKSIFYHNKKNSKKMSPAESPIPDDSPNKTNTAKCLETFLKSELQYIPPSWPTESSPGFADFSALLNFIIAPSQKEEEANTSAAARMSSMLEEIMEAETTPTND